MSKSPLSTQISKQNISQKIQLKTFTTRVDTIFSVSFLAIAPEHPDLDKLVKDFQRAEVDKYLQEVKNKSERERQISKQKTGVWTGSYAKNPLTGKLVPIFVADYVLASYGTGAVMGVAGHDQRDYEFVLAINKSLQDQKANTSDSQKQQLQPLEILKNVAKSKEEAEAKDSSIQKDTKNVNKQEESEQEVFSEDGFLFNSGIFSGLSSAEAREKIAEELTKRGKGQKRTNYKFRDWVFSRQRYWGEPFPFVYIPLEEDSETSRTQPNSKKETESTSKTEDK